MIQLPALSAEQFEAAAKANELSRADHDNTSSHKDQDPSPVSSHEAELEDEAQTDDEGGDQDGDEDRDENDLMKDTIDVSSRCLFCNLVSPTMEMSILHMHTGHGLFIPSSDQLLDMETFLGYLASIIFTHNTCLYCNTERGSVVGIQAHMRDKGHCMINLDAESELLDFWELGDSDEEGDDVVAKMAAVKLSGSEMRLPSGAIINARSDASQLRAKPSLTQSRQKGSRFRIKRNDLKAIADADAESQPTTSDSEPNRSWSRNDRQVTVRGEMGILGLSDMQKRALQVMEKKIKKRETVARAAQRWATERASNKQKYFKV